MKGNIQIDIAIRQEKTCAICGRAYNCRVEHTITTDELDKIPKLTEQMTAIIERNPYFQICDTCREQIQNPQYIIRA